MVFTPSRPKLYTLDLNAWLIFELCVDNSFSELEKGYAEAIGAKRSPAELSLDLVDGLEQLSNYGIIEEVASSRHADKGAHGEK